MRRSRKQCDFVGPDRALAGIRGHQQIQCSRPAGYQKEIPVSYEVETDAFIFRVRERIDDLLLTPAENLLEEIKTIRRSWDCEADPLHWAQGKFYGFMYPYRRGAEHQQRSDSGRKNASTAGARLRAATRGAGVGGMNTTENRINGCLISEERIDIPIPHQSLKP